MSTRLVPTPERTEERVRQLATVDANGRTTIRLPRRRVGQPCIVSRLIGATVAVTNPVLLDAFGRVVVNGWGSPDTGPPYAVVEGAATDFGVGSTAGVGSIFTTATGLRKSIASPIGVTDITLTGAQSVVGAFARQMGLMARVQGDPMIDTYYCARCVMDAAGNTTAIRIEKSINGVGRTTLAIFTYPVALTAGLTQVRITCVGFTISASAWKDVEPSNPQVSATDLDIPGAGGVGAFMNMNGADTSEGRFDNFLAESLQTGPIWDAYINSPDQLFNIVDSSIVPVDRWIPQIVNGQRLNPGEELVITSREGTPGTQAVVTCSFVYST